MVASGPASAGLTHTAPPLLRFWPQAVMALLPLLVWMGGSAGAGGAGGAAVGEVAGGAGKHTQYVTNARYRNQLCKRWAACTSSPVKPVMITRQSSFVGNANDGATLQK